MALEMAQPLRSKAAVSEGLGLFSALFPSVFQSPITPVLVNSTVVLLTLFKI